MSHKVITSLIPNYQKLKDSKVFLGLTFLSVCIRFPFFFRDYIDRDESTFILMAQSWVDGYLPYTQLWDLKPPLVFLFFAIIIYFFGKSFIAIRLFGAIAVAVVALYTYKIGKEIHSPRTGFWAATGCVYLLSLFGSVQGVMSEHLSMICFMPATYYLIKYRSTKWYFAAGICFGLSLMMKLNLAYAVMGIVLWLQARAIYEKQISLGIVRILFLGLTILLVAGVTFLPYYISGIPEVWTNSVILAPLAYSNDLMTSFLNVLPLTSVLLGLGILSWKRKWINFHDRNMQFIAVIIAGILISFFKSGKVNGHYLMQLYPFLLLFTGIILSKTFQRRDKYYPIVLFLALLLPVESYAEFVNVFKNKKAYGSYFNGEGITVPTFIRDHHLNEDNVLFFEYHIGYWLLDSSPPSMAATHPSNICRPELFPYFNNPRKTALDELEYLLDTLKPETVVTRKDKSVFDQELVAEDAYVRSYLSQHYRLVGLSGRAEIFTRLQGD